MAKVAEFTFWALLADQGREASWMARSELVVTFSQWGLGSLGAMLEDVGRR